MASWKELFWWVEKEAALRMRLSGAHLPRRQGPSRAHLVLATAWAALAGAAALALFGLLFLHGATTRTWVATVLSLDLFVMRSVTALLVVFIWVANGSANGTVPFVPFAALVVIGGVSLAMAEATWRERRWAERTTLFLLFVASVGSVVFAIRMDPTTTWRAP